jgi:ribonuclease P protein component
LGNSFPKSVRILRSADFRRVYDDGFRIAGPYFAAFCLRRADQQGTAIGLTLPRALGNSVTRNRVKRRIREAVRLRLRQLEPGWEIVINPRRAARDAVFEDLTREIERLFARCNVS